MSSPAASLTSATIPPPALPTNRPPPPPPLPPFRPRRAAPLHRPRRRQARTPTTWTRPAGPARETGRPRPRRNAVDSSRTRARPCHQAARAAKAVHHSIDSAGPGRERRSRSPLRITPPSFMGLAESRQITAAVRLRYPKQAS